MSSYYRNMKISTSKREGAFASLAAILVLFTALWDPLISVIVSVVVLLGYAVFKFIEK